MIDILVTADHQSEEREGKRDSSPIYNTQMSVILVIFVLPSLQVICRYCAACVTSSNTIAVNLINIIIQTFAGGLSERS